MRGFAGFLTGLIGFCFCAAIAFPAGMVMRNAEGGAVVLLLAVGACVFLNVMVVGFYRLLGQLHETALFPDDPYYYPQRGRVQFFVGYLGLIATVGLTVVITFYVEVLRIRIGGGDLRAFLLLAWLVGWVFLGVFLGGVLSMLRDLHQKLFMNAGAGRRSLDGDDDIDIRLSRSSRAAANEPTEKRVAKPWDEV
jgi:hypothetical protein